MILLDLNKNAREEREQFLLKSCDEIRDFLWDMALETDGHSDQITELRKRLNNAENDVSKADTDLADLYFKTEKLEDAIANIEEWVVDANEMITRIARSANFTLCMGDAIDEVLGDGGIVSKRQLHDRAEELYAERTERAANFEDAQASEVDADESEEDGGEETEDGGEE